MIAQKGMTMELGALEIYLIIINVVGFVAFAINTWLYGNTPEGQIDAALNVITFLGGSLGIVISILVFDRKSFVIKHNRKDPSKDTSHTALSRIFVICMLVIQVVLYLTIKQIDVMGFLTSVGDSIWNFLAEHKIEIIVLSLYLVLINIITFIVYGVDKYRANNNKKRIREMVLFLLAFAGGSVGALIAMPVFHHKIAEEKNYFKYGNILILIMQIIVIAYLLFAI